MPKPGEGEKLGVERTGTRARIVADLPAGEYVLDAFARMPEGDASYGFPLVVKRDAAAAGKAPLGPRTPRPSDLAGTSPCSKGWSARRTH